MDSITVQPSTVEVSQLNEQIHFTATALDASGGVVEDASGTATVTVTPTLDP